IPEDRYWWAWDSFVENEVATRGLIAHDDRDLYRVTDDARKAADEILGFYRNYDSIRWVGDVLVVRVRRRPDPAQLEDLRVRFRDLTASGTIDVSDALPVEVRDHDKTDLDRVVLRFNHRSYGGLRRLIDALNEIDAS
ncbi:MAG TPA: Rossman fold protein, TIGR00730 family, partial [Acidimicrobiales bacterium]|nr:Rossman fold protein, TIGR00730 family [Acidimicrobiales bacterium]